MTGIRPQSGDVPRPCHALTFPTSVGPATATAMMGYGRIALRHFFGKRLQIAARCPPHTTLTMTTATTTTMMTTTPDWGEEAARVHALRLATWEWREGPVGGRTRLVKDIARERGASDPVITCVYLRVSAGLRPNALAFQDLDAYVAAWRDALVKELRAYKGAVLYCVNAIRARRRDEARFLAMKGAKTHRKARAPRAWRRNAERMALHWPEAH
jgi:hypothetical protein